ncbi:MAG: hypothetical protein SFZ03_05045 [Candidatus Melainabacteria bacterium]|nr:hypothetical protein [Candidatus Melainabacteria bacterium]
MPPYSFGSYEGARPLPYFPAASTWNSPPPAVTMNGLPTALAPSSRPLGSAQNLGQNLGQTLGRNYGATAGAKTWTEGMPVETSLNNPAAFELMGIRVGNLDSMLHQLGETNPMVTKLLLRINGFWNEMYETFVDWLKFAGQEKGLDRAAEGIVKAKPFAATTEKMVNLKLISAEKTSFASLVKTLSYGVVLGYCVADGAYSGYRGYKLAKEETGNTAYARARGLQMFTGQLLFQYMASYYVPATVICNVIQPTVKTVYHKAVEMINRVANTSLNVEVGRTKHVGIALGAVASIWGVQQMIKHFDPFFEYVTHYFYDKTNPLFKKWFPDVKAQSHPHQAERYRSIS